MNTIQNTDKSVQISPTKWILWSFIILDGNIYCQMKNKPNSIDLMSIEAMFLKSKLMFWKRFYDTFLISPKSKYFENLSNDLKMIHENNLLLLYDCTDKFTNQRNVDLFIKYALVDGHVTIPTTRIDVSFF